MIIMEKETFDNGGNITYGDGFSSGGSFLSTPLPSNIKDFEEKYPMAYKYIILKRPVMISFEVDRVVLYFKYNPSFAYGSEDIDLFNQLTEEMFPKLID